MAVAGPLPRTPGSPHWPRCCDEPATPGIGGCLSEAFAACFLARSGAPVIFSFPLDEAQHGRLGNCMHGVKIILDGPPKQVTRLSTRLEGHRHGCWPVSTPAISRATDATVRWSRLTPSTQLDPPGHDEDQQAVQSADSGLSRPVTNLFGDLLAGDDRRRIPASSPTTSTLSPSWIARGAGPAVRPSDLSWSQRDGTVSCAWLPGGARPGQRQVRRPPGSGR